MNNNNGKSLQEIIIGRLDLSREMTEEEIRELIDEQIRQESKKRNLEVMAREQLRREIFHSLLLIGILL